LRLASGQAAFLIGTHEADMPGDIGRQSSVNARSAVKEYYP
jgi:hypothetical protein